MKGMEQAEPIVPADPANELTERLGNIADSANQGQIFSASDYLILVSIGIVIPIILLVVGWYA
jgi:hypothetical protein